jgi:hypothetical protein
MNTRRNFNASVLAALAPSVTAPWGGQVSPLIQSAIMTGAIRLNSCTHRRWHG